MKTPEDETGLDPTEQGLVAHLAVFDEALRSTNDPAEDTSVSNLLPPEALQRLRAAQCLLRAVKQARPNPSRSPTRPAGTHDPVRLPAEHDWPRIDGYEVLGFLGRGGMGAVYKARHVALNRPTALKLLLAGACAGREELSRFRSEAEAVAKLQHPNIVQIFEIGEQNGLPYLALEYVAGPSLAVSLNGVAQPAAESAALVELLARAMHHAHEHGIVHRDLKPANILLQTVAGGQWPVASPDKSQVPPSLTTEHWPPATVPKIADFGLAKHLDANDRTQHTQSGAVLGSINYMAPEQAEGRRRRIGPAADIYSLGTILYQLLTGRTPFQGESSADTLRQVLFEEPLAPRRLRRTLPRDLETICLRCLEKEPRKRYPTAEALADDLGRFRAGRPIAARPIRAWERAWKWACRQPLVAALALTIVLLIVASFFLIAREWRKALASAQSEAAARREVERLLAANMLDQALSLCEQGEVGAGMLRLAHCLELAEQAEAADLARACRINLSAWRGRLIRQRAALPHKHWVWDVEFSPDGQRILTGSLDGTARLWDALTGQPVGEPLEHQGAVWSAAFSPDGGTILTSSGPRDNKAEFVHLWDAATQKPRRPPFSPGKLAAPPAFSADGKTILVLTDGQAQVWETGSAESATPLTLQHPGRVRAARFRPGTSEVLTAGEDGTARLWKLPTGDATGARFEHPGPVIEAAFSPDGRTLATVHFIPTDQLAPGVGNLWDLDSGKAIATGLPHPGRVKAVAFSRDGRMLLTASVAPKQDAKGPLTGEARLWNTTDGQPLGPPVVHHAGPVWSVAFSPDGKIFLTGCEDRRARLWHTACRQPLGPPLDVHDLVRKVAFSPDGRLAIGASAGERATARLWEVPPGQALTPPLQFGEGVYLLALSPDQRTLFVSGEKGASAFWDVASRQPLGAVKQHATPVRAGVFSPDGKTLFTSRAGAMETWATTNHELVGPSRNTGLVDTVVHFSPDRRFFLMVTRSEVLRRDTATGIPLKFHRPHGGVLATAFSPDSQTLVIATDAGIQRFETATDRLLTTLLRGEDQTGAVAIHPDNRTLLVGTRDGRVRFWDMETDRPLSPPLRHPGWIRAASFSADGRIACTSSSEGGVRLWDVTVGKPLGPPLPHDAVVAVVAQHGDRTTVISGGADRMVHFWEVPPPWPGDVRQVRRDVELLTGMEPGPGNVIQHGLPNR